MLRLVHGLRILGPKEKMTTKVAEALILRFNQPLFNENIAAIVEITSLDARVLKDIVGLTNSYSLSTVYGPTDEARKDDFLVEIARVAPLVGVAWLINGNSKARDKRNYNIKCEIIGKFRAALDAGA
ncbi:Histidyl-tRNA synthetase [Hordeum vulgare]|nr:Histidyl-tRNA synthetase [Hordeum vulgare]